MTLRERFDKKWTPEPFSGCWIWIGAMNNNGYGGIKIGRNKVLVHRVSWEIHRGEIPKGANVLHHCDTRCCVNPDHLFIGTQSDNIKDSVNKGRFIRYGYKGSEHPSSKLTEQQVLEIRKSSDSNKSLSEKYGVCRSSISGIKRCDSWRHI